ncbi:MAG: hypothetical protein OHK0017_02800 [Patescibacteria group bacterium]
MLSINANKDSIQLTTSNKVKVNLVLNPNVKDLDPENHVTLLANKSFSDVWADNARTISLPGQYGRNDLEINCQQDKNGKLFYNVQLDNLKVGLVPSLESDEELVLESNSDLVVINCEKAKTDKVIGFLNNLAAKTALVIGSENTLAELVEKSKLSFQEVEKDYKHKSTNSESLQLYKFVV